MKTTWWQPENYGKRLPYLEQRSRIVAAIRTHFVSAGFYEVETPALQFSPGLEPHLMAFRTEYESPIAKQKESYYLHTSPEFTMKKLLSAGLPKIFQMARVYRNREWSDTHHPEFTMLEWYRSGASYETIMDDTVELLRACMRAVPERKWATWKGVSCDFFSPWERLTVQEAFLKYAATDLLATIDNPQNPSAHTLAQVARTMGLHTAQDDSWEDLFFRIFLEKIEPNLGKGVPTILYDYPISMAALSRPKPSNPELSERFEVYVAGLELANAFGELTDPKAQRARFEADMAKKEKLYGFRYPIDEDFLSALKIFPESSGIALGVDRLVMLLTGATQISDVLWAPVASTAALDS